MNIPALVKAASLTIGIFNLVLSSMLLIGSTFFVGFLFIFWEEHHAGGGDRDSIRIMFDLGLSVFLTECVIAIVTNSCLVDGVRKGLPGLLLPYCIWTSVNLILTILILALFHNFMFDTLLDFGANMWTTFIGVAFFYILALWSVICVSKHRRELLANSGRKFHQKTSIRHKKAAGSSWSFASNI